jgi:hypothetical protein
LLLSITEEEYLSQFPPEYQSQLNMSSKKNQSSTKKSRSSSAFSSPPINSPQRSTRSRNKAENFYDSPASSYGGNELAYYASPSSSVASGQTRVTSPAALDWEANYHFDGEVVDFKIQLKNKEMSSFPFSVLTVFATAGHKTKDKAHFMDTLHIAFPLSHSIGWETVWGPNRARLTKAGDGILVRIPDFHACMFQSMDTIGMRLEQELGPSDARSTALKVQKIKLEDVGIIYKSFFLQFPINENTNLPFKCTNKEFQKHTGVHTLDSLVDTHPAIKSLVHKDECTGKQNNSIFYYIWTVGIEGSRSQVARVREEKPGAYNMFDFRQALKSADNANGGYDEDYGNNDSMDESKGNESEDSDDEFDGEYSAKLECVNTNLFTMPTRTLYFLRLFYSRL